MAEYRAYVVGNDGHFIRFISLVCEDDAEATKQAYELSTENQIELWSGTRLVAQITPSRSESD